MPVAAFDVLFRMAAECASRYNGLLSLAVEERAAPEVRRVGRDELPPLEYPAAAFPVENTAYPDGEDVTILVTFAEDLSKATLKRTKQLIECWGKLVTLGGFRPRGDVPSSCGFLSDSSSHLDNEVVCTIQQLNASAQIWGPLIHGLGVIHQDAAIEGVEIY